MDARTAPATVLVVDDDQGLSRLIHTTLEREGFNVFTAISGQEAIAWLMANRADLMLLDLKLHDIEGKELINHLAEVQRVTPFVIITGQGDEREAVEMMKRGALDYLVKDVQFIEFVPTVVRRALQQLEKDQSLARAQNQAHLTQTVVEQAHSGVMVTSPDSHDPEIVYVNRAFAKLIACARNKLVGTRLSHLETLTGPWAQFRLALAKGKSFHEETQITPCRGAPRFADCSITRVLDSRGNHTHWAVLLRDITRRKRSEQALSLSEANLANAQKVAHLGSYEFDLPRANQLHWSKETFRIVGLRRAGGKLSLKEYLRRVVHPDDRARVRANLDRTIKEGARYDVEYRIVRPDGSIRHVHSIGEPLLGQDKRVVKLVGTLQDITERKQLEGEIREISEREQSRIGQELHDSLGQQLTAIGLSCESLRGDLVSACPKLEPQAARICRDVGEAIAQTRVLAHGLTAFRLEIEGLQTALLKLARATSTRARLRCRFECSSSITLAGSVAAAHLYRIAQEAVNNAIKHSQASEITIRLSQTNNILRLEIRDNGKGLRRFEKPGQGLGLRLMQHRAGVIGGEVEVRSRAGKGVAVVCTLRRKQ